MKLRVMSKIEGYPGPRYKNQGPGSGEEFREKYLKKAFDEAVSKDEILVVDMEGSPFGYPTSFLEEAFGGLARIRGTDKVKRNIKIICVSEPHLKEEIIHYINYSETEKTPPFDPFEK